MKYSSATEHSEKSFARDLCRLLQTFLLAGLMAVPAAGEAGALELSGWLGGRVGSFEADDSSLAGGFGRLTPAPVEGGETAGKIQLHLLLEATITERWRAFLHATAREAWVEGDPDGLAGRPSGVVEAFVERRAALARGGSSRFWLGHFLLPTSRENVELGWSSPYTLSFSALNTWIGEEARVSGLGAELVEPLSTLDSLRVGLSVFGGSDTSGALLAWRGWSMGDRLSVLGETLPLPPLPGLDDGASFGAQRDDGTRPFGSDLDHRAGWAGWARVSRHQRGMLQWTHFDNRGDRALHGRPDRQEYAWDTRFHLVAGELRLGDWTLAAEWMLGRSDMGLPPNDLVAIDFEAAYALISWFRHNWRLSLRYDDFRVEDRDRTPFDLNDDRGDAWTMAIFWEPRTTLRVGLEALELETLRPQTDPMGSPSKHRSLLLDVRWYFGL